VLLNCFLNVCICNDISSDQNEITIDCLKLIDLSQSITEVGATFKCNDINFDSFVVVAFQEGIYLTSMMRNSNEDFSHLVHEKKLDDIVYQGHIGNWEHAF
jgi:hypothetical protein